MSYVIYVKVCQTIYKYDKLREEDEIGGPFSTNVEKRNSHRLSVGNPEGKIPLGRPRRR
jgi:hypothetical protein